VLKRQDGTTLRTAIKRLLMLSPPLRRHFVLKDALVEERERLATELSDRTSERDQAYETMDVLKAEHESLKHQLLQLANDRGTAKDADKEGERLMAELEARVAERDAALRMVSQLRLTATAFLVQRDEARMGKKTV
jgi:chromosome segregation ATPase